MTDEKHLHKGHPIKVELENRMKQWEELIAKINHLKFILQEEYPKIKPIARYLE